MDFRDIEQFKDTVIWHGDKIIIGQYNDVKFFALEIDDCVALFPYGLCGCRTHEEALKKIQVVMEYMFEYIQWSYEEIGYEYMKELVAHHKEMRDKGKLKGGTYENREEKKEEVIAKQKPFTQEEEEIMDRLVSAWNIFTDLEITHKDEFDDFAQAIKDAQQILMNRVLRRDYPESFPSQS